MDNIITIRITTAAPIQSGERTHHQLQSIVFVSFNITKTIVNIQERPIPPELPFELLIYY